MSKNYDMMVDALFPEDSSMFVNNETRAAEEEEPHDCGDPGVLADPLYKVSSVTICSTLLPCHIYGTIQIYDVITNKLRAIYGRTRDHAEPITSESDCLTLRTSEVDVIYMRAPQIYIDLKAKGKGTDVSISLGTLPLAEITQDKLEESKSLTVPGEQGHACVRYLAYAFAVTANLELTLTAKAVTAWLRRCSSSQNNKRDVYGKITVYPVPVYGWAGLQECPETVTQLFSRPKTRFQTITLGSPLKLDKSLVAVPVYSALRVKVSLFQYGSDEVVFEDEVVVTAVRSTDYEDEVFCGKEFDLGVHVDWLVPFNLDKDNEGHKTTLTIGGLQPLHNSPWIRGSKLVEVFSVCIFRETDVPLSLFGNINYMDDATNTINDRTMNNPQVLTHGERYLSLTNPCETLCWNANFCLFVKLNDVTGTFSTIGYAQINELCNCLSYWFDRPYCSIIRGPCGFAAVHYTVFSSAVKASVKVFYCKGESDVEVGMVDGMLTATYGESQPLESYSNKCCRIVLFSGSFDPCQGSEIPLSRYTFASPLNRSLLIGVKLCANSSTCVSDTAVFQPDANGASQVIMGKEFGVRIVVEWGRPDEENF